VLAQALDVQHDRLHDQLLDLAAARGDRDTTGQVGQPRPPAGRPHYAASKAGLHGLAHFLASRAAGDGVTVNVLAPGFIETAMLPDNPDKLAQAIPIGRTGRPEETADLALAILRNGYLTSQVLSLDGGMHPR